MRSRRWRPRLSFPRLPRRVLLTDTRPIKFWSAAGAATHGSGRLVMDRCEEGFDRDGRIPGFGKGHRAASVNVAQDFLLPAGPSQARGLTSVWPRSRRRRGSDELHRRGQGRHQGRTRHCPDLAGHGHCRAARPSTPVPTAIRPLRVDPNAPSQHVGEAHVIQHTPQAQRAGGRIGRPTGVAGGAGNEIPSQPARRPALPRPRSRRRHAAWPQARRQWSRPARRRARTAASPKRRSALPPPLRVPAAQPAPPVSPRGPTSENQPTSSRPGMVSATVGISGISGWRSREPTARARARPSRIIARPTGSRLA